jgi:hypothetical protein
MSGLTSWAGRVLSGVAVSACLRSPTKGGTWLVGACCLAAAGTCCSRASPVRLRRMRWVAAAPAFVAAAAGAAAA